MNLTASEIYQEAIAAGFSGEDAVTATAIALAESSGNASSVTNEPNGSTSYGLWQINSANLGNYSPDDLTSNPADNAAQAYSLFSSRGFEPWSTYNSGAYASYLGEAQQAASGAISSVEDMPSALGNLFDGMSDEQQSLVTGTLSPATAAANTPASSAQTTITPGKQVDVTDISSVASTGLSALGSAITSGVSSLTSAGSSWIIDIALIALGVALLFGAWAIFSKPEKSSGATIVLA